MEESQSFFLKPTIGSQFLLAVVALFVLFIVYMSVETVYKRIQQMNSAKLAVYPYTGSATRTIIIPQNPADPKAKTLYLSENEITGIEFSYSVFLYINESTFQSTDTTNTMKTVFHKGYKAPFPLCGPGVFVHSNENKLRIVMNSFEKWFNYVDIPGVPINKWFHLVLVCRNNQLEVYVNGNLSTKLSFNGTVPYQNYQNIVIFSNENLTGSKFTNSGTGLNILGSVPTGTTMVTSGPMSGYISNLYYFRYAISYSEIQAMMNLGPSKEFDQGSMDIPPYLIDSWWTQPTSS